MRCSTWREWGFLTVLLAVALVGLNGCNLMHREPEPQPPPASEQMIIQADQAWQARDYEGARRLYGMIVESFPGDPACEEAYLRLAAMEVVLPGDGPDVGKTLELLALMDEESMTASQAASREALVKLLELYRGDREAIRMLTDLNHRQEAQLDGQKLEAYRQEARLHQRRLDVDQANQRVEQLEVELDNIRQEIQLLKDIDMMLQTETGEEPPSPPEE
jgi:hypothetical protein